PALRLAPSFAGSLRLASASQDVDWALVLALLRAQGARDAVPADPAKLAAVAAKLAAAGPVKDDYATALAYAGANETDFADQVAALARYDRAVGLDALVRGLEATKTALATR